MWATGAATEKARRLHLPRLHGGAEQLGGVGGAWWFPDGLSVADQADAGALHGGASLGAGAGAGAKAAMEAVESTRRAVEALGLHSGHGSAVDDILAEHGFEHGFEHDHDGGLGGEGGGEGAGASPARWHIWRRPGRSPDDGAGWRPKGLVAAATAATVATGTAAAPPLEFEHEPAYYSYRRDPATRVHGGGGGGGGGGDGGDGDGSWGGGGAAAHRCRPHGRRLHGHVVQARAFEWLGRPVVVEAYTPVFAPHQGHHRPAQRRPPQKRGAQQGGWGGNHADDAW